VNITSPMPVVIAISCGWDGSCDAAEYGSITGIPSGCVGTTVDTFDAGSTSALYTCNSVSSSFNVVVSAAMPFADDMAMAAYGFQR
jgi:hypothetical protein